jgi:hypothetical protein
MSPHLRIAEAVTSAERSWRTASGGQGTAHLETLLSKDDQGALRPSGIAGYVLLAEPLILAVTAR